MVGVVSIFRRRLLGPAIVLAAGWLAAAPAFAFDPALVARAKAINGAGFSASAAPRDKDMADFALIKAQLLLARVHASPGPIDGRAGTNFKHAIEAFQQMKGLPDDGRLTQAVWDALNTQPPHPITAIYTVTPQDVAGPFSPNVGEDFVALSKLPSPGYTHVSEMLAERFQMSEWLLKTLNPGADFGKAGTELVVTQPWIPALPAIDHIEVDKAVATVRAYDAANHLVATFPATVGSRERPSPSGVRKVVWPTINPIYTYDPSKLTWGPKGHGVLTIQPGPNNPVGLVWIKLNAPGYGIHGTPDPDHIGKTASHGCVRLTNWDAILLAHAVRSGVVVTFVNDRPQA